VVVYTHTGANAIEAFVLGFRDWIKKEKFAKIMPE